jgi:hypothetical protein
MSSKLPLISCEVLDRRIDQHDLRIFCHKHARYLIVTKELVEYLKTVIGGRSAIEIGAGSGDLGFHLGIHMTDNYCQTWPDVVSFYQSTQQPTVNYGSDVERLDAVDAVKKYKPKVVVGAWVTQWIDPDLPPESPGSIYGIKEDEILDLVDTYIVIGAEGIHKEKKILKYPHKVIDAPFVRSRRTDNKIWIWNKWER